ncbi:carbohydrate ABC transporter permease, partial [Streptomyces buecherae]
MSGELSSKDLVDMPTALELPSAQPPVKAVPPTVSGAGRQRGDRTGGVLNVFSHGILAVWGLLVTLPLLWAAMSSLKTDREIFTSPWSLPSSLHFQNWSDAWNTANMGRYFLNSAVVVAGSLFGTMLLGAMAAYVLARFEFRGNRF